MYKINELHMARKELDNLKNIFVFPYPILFYKHWSVDRKNIFLTSQIGYPLNLIVNSPAIGNECKYSKTCVKLPLKRDKTKITKRA